MKLLIILMVCGSAALAQDQVRDFTKQDADRFARIVASRESSRENYVVTARILQNKRSLFTNLVQVLEKEHQVKADFPYSFDVEQNALYQLSTNALKRSEQPKRTLIKKFKNVEEAAPLTNLMVSRQRLERQIVSLAELAEENRQENIRWDEHLRKTFGLAPMTRYQLKKVNDDKYQLVLIKDQQQPQANEKKK